MHHSFVSLGIVGVEGVGGGGDKARLNYCCDLISDESQPCRRCAGGFNFPPKDSHILSTKNNSVFAYVVGIYST